MNTTTTETKAIPTHFATSYTFTAPNGHSEALTIQMSLPTRDLHVAIRNLCALRRQRTQEGWTVTRHEHIA